MVPNDELGASVDHGPLLVENVFLLVSVNDVVLLHLLQRVRSSRFVADLNLSFSDHTNTTISLSNNARSVCLNI